MRRPDWRLLAGAFALAAAACHATIDGATNGIDAGACFARLQTMAGSYEVDFEGQSEPSKVIWDNVSGGHAISEKLNAGTPHEMVSLYFLEGENLVVTHYCAIGNRPTLRLDRARSTRDEWFFDYDPATTGIDPKSDAHIHAAHFKWLDGGSLDAEWVFWMDGAEQHRKVFQLRKEPGKFVADPEG